ncbi:MAG: transposase [Nitrosospira sp.]
MLKSSHAALPRFILPDIPLHIIRRGSNRHACFFADEDYSVYLDWLGEHASKTGCRVHSYVLMTNHVHLLISADRVEAPGLLMKATGKIRTIMQDADIFGK